MSIAELKKNIQKFIDETENSQLLEQFYLIIKDQPDHDIIEELSESQKARLYKTLDEINISTVNDVDARKIISSWLKK